MGQASSPTGRRSGPHAAPGALALAALAFSGLAGACREPSAGRVMPSEIGQCPRGFTLGAGGQWCYRGLPPDGEGSARIDSSLPDGGPAAPGGPVDANRMMDGDPLTLPRTLGDGGSEVRVGGGPPLAEHVFAGARNTCAVLTDRTLHCWGANDSGQLGNGTTVSSPVPVRVKDLENVADVAIGANHICATLYSGELRCWGANGSGQLGNGGSEGSTTPVRVSFTGATDQITGTPPHHTVTAGDRHSCVVTRTGEVRCWGSNMLGQLGNPVAGQSPMPVAVEQLTGATDLSAGPEHTCAVVTGGSVKCWGRNDLDQLGNGTGIQSAVPVVSRHVEPPLHVATSGSRTCAVCDCNIFMCWGDPAGWFQCGLLGASKLLVCLGQNDHGQLGNGTTTSSVSPVSVSVEIEATHVAQGQAHACAVFVDHSIRCWGRNDQGQLGNGTTAGSLVPVTVMPAW